MIQIEDWAILAVILVFLLACIIYLIYFLRTRKLFPQIITFNKQIQPKNAESMVKIDGKGIIKKVELQLPKNGNLLIDMIIDQTNYSILDFTTDSAEKTVGQQKNTGTSKFEVNVDRKFFKGFSIFIQNKSEELIDSSGRVFYEIKQPQN
jgi:hypothetical protein